jgi:hypothetical protein
MGNSEIPAFKVPQRIYVYTVDNQDFQGILKVYYVGEEEEEEEAPPLRNYVNIYHVTPCLRTKPSIKNSVLYSV